MCTFLLRLSVTLDWLHYPVTDTVWVLISQKDSSVQGCLLFLRQTLHSPGWPQTHGSPSTPSLPNAGIMSTNTLLSQIHFYPQNISKSPDVKYCLSSVYIYSGLFLLRHPGWLCWENCVYSLWVVVCLSHWAKSVVLKHGSQPTWQTFVSTIIYIMIYNCSKITAMT